MVIFYKKWKKYNEIQLTKKEMVLNNRKMTNHPPSPVQHKYNKLQKKVLKIRAKCKSANIWSSTVQLHGVDLIDIQVQNWL